MLKKAVARTLGFTLAVTLCAPFHAAEVRAADVFTEENGIYETARESYTEEEQAGNLFTSDAYLVAGEELFGDTAAFSDGEEPPSTDTEETVAEKTLAVTEGEDITTKLNAALLEMKEQATDEKPAKVIIPPGNYRITDTISTYSNIHLYAEGAVLKKTSAKKQLMLRLGNTAESAGGYEGYRNIVIEGGTWDANYESVPDKEEAGGFVCFRIGHASNVQIKNVTFLNNLKSHFLEFGGVKNARVSGCTFRGYWEPYAGGGQECIQIDACRDFIFPDYLPYDGSVCEDIYIEENTFEQVLAGVGSHSMIFDMPYRNIRIRKNTFRDIGKRAVWCLNYVDSSVEDNVMTNVGAGVYVRSVYSDNTLLRSANQYASNLTVANNEIVLNPAKVIGDSLWKSFGIGLVGEKCAGAASEVPDGIYPVRGVTVKNNKISGPGNGIRMVLAEDCRILDNTLELTAPEDFDNIGILLGAGSSNQASGNKIQGTKGEGIYLYRGPAEYNEPSRNNALTGNTITGTSGDGITVGKDSNGTKLEKNTVKALEGNGVRIFKNSGVTLTGNTVSECKKNGISLASTENATITGNTVDHNAVDGIKSEENNKKLLVTKNRCIKNQGAGMCIGGSNGASLIENEIVANKNNGISLIGSLEVAISRNRIRSNKGYALIGTDSDVKTYSRNTLKSNEHTDTIYAINTSLPYSLEKEKVRKILRK